MNKDNNQSKGIHIIDMKNKQFINIGRSNDSDIRISDISVLINSLLVLLNVINRSRGTTPR